jgi:hypothetical protein
MLRSFMLGFLLIAVLCSVCFAENYVETMDRIYADLADIIEANMDNPGQCLAGIDRYFEQNRDTITKAREEGERALAQAGPMAQSMMGEYSSMGMDALGEEGKSIQERTEARMNPEMVKYTRALEAFVTRHPAYALQLATKMMQLVPGFGGQMPLQLPLEIPTEIPIE